MLAVVDRRVSADGTAQRAFFIGRCGCDHACTGGLGNLDGRRADATGRAQHQHGFAGLELAAVDQRMVRGGVNHDEGRCVDRRKTGRQRHAQRSWRQRVRAKTAGARQAGHALADLEVGDAFAHRLDTASVFGTRHKGQGRLHLVLVLHDQQVGEVQTGGLDGDAHLSGARHRRGQLFPGQGVDTDRVFTEPGMHNFSRTDR